MKEIRLLVAIPSTHSWEADFGMSMVMLCTHLAANNQIDGKQLHIQVQNKKGSLLQNMREWFVQQALENKATHLLFLDSDQTFPRDVFHRLYAHGKHIVAANVATKLLPSSPTARGLPDEVWKTGTSIYTLPESTGLEQVWRIGTGVMLIDLNVFKRKGMKAPWFQQEWCPELNSYRGEDWGFCEKLEKADVKLFIDHDISKEVGHVGKLIYHHDLVEVV